MRIPLNEGDHFHTIGGRITGPFPKTTYKQRSYTEKKVCQWLKAEAIAEAKHRDDDYNLVAWEGLNVKNWSQADGDCVNEYLFGRPEGDIGCLKL